MRRGCAPLPTRATRRRSCACFVPSTRLIQCTPTRGQRAASLPSSLSLPVPRRRAVGRDGLATRSGGKLFPPLLHAPVLRGEDVRVGWGITRPLYTQKENSNRATGRSAPDGERPLERYGSDAPCRGGHRHGGGPKRGRVPICWRPPAARRRSARRAKGAHSSREQLWPCYSVVRRPRAARAAAGSCVRWRSFGSAGRGGQSIRLSTPTESHLPRPLIMRCKEDAGQRAETDGGNNRARPAPVCHAGQCKECTPRGLVLSGPPMPGSWIEKEYGPFHSHAQG